MGNLVSLLTQKLAVVLVLSLSAIGSFLNTSPAVFTTSSAQTIQLGPLSQPALVVASIPLPTTTLAFAPMSPVKIASPVVVVTVASTKKASVISPLTASQLLASTTLVFNEQLNALYKLTFGVPTGNGENITWGLDATEITSPALSAPLSFSYNCTPPPDAPAPDAALQIPLFEPSSPYACTISLTPESGSDRWTQTRTFNFNTPAGGLAISAAAGNTLLVNDTNNGGFTFNNEDKSPVTITGLTLDVSLTALNLQNGPLVLRILDPATGQSLYDYHLETIPQDPTNGYLHEQSNIQIPLSFTIGGSDQKLLPIEVLGVDKMYVSSVNPTVAITLSGATLDRSDMKVVLADPNLSWSCIVPSTAYDPNATSGPYADGTACQN